MALEAREKSHSRRAQFESDPRAKSPRALVNDAGAFVDGTGAKNKPHTCQLTAVWWSRQPDVLIEVYRDAEGANALGIVEKDRCRQSKGSATRSLSLDPLQF